MIDCNLPHPSGTPEGAVNTTFTECPVPHTADPVPEYVFFLTFVVVLAGIAGIMYLADKIWYGRPPVEGTTARP